ncbi:proto-oncogene tyrosine-protein kinase receptor Ret-like [Tropilaelaps mercedesae]|uniref:Proto-oncogene tyrosine-protein kinase receptor Ret-like n=1 Tax=Tropilaelaps mercedesae TaxID=418985 RepID=A0A1V9XQU2_9ACAR|nr:proto-oncogene tyrosine-protein kinase receptor Ret-like [Tropilaelaps mercedesae]
MFTPLRRFCNRIAHYHFQPADLLSYDETTRTVRTLRQIASDKGSLRQSATIFCQIDGDPSRRVFNHSVTIVLALRRPQARMLAAGHPGCHIIIRRGKNPQCDLQAVDVDPRGRYRARPVNDRLGIFQTKTALFFPDSKHRRVVINVSARPAVSFYPDANYSFDVVLEDESKHHLGYRNLTFHVAVTNHSMLDLPLDLKQAKSLANLTIGLSSIYARVVPALYPHGGDRYIFRADREQWHKAFNVTPKEGIVYLQNPLLIKSAVGKRVRLRVNVYENPSHEMFNNTTNGTTHHAIFVNVHENNELTNCNDKVLAGLRGNASQPAQQGCPTDVVCGAKGKQLFLALKYVRSLGRTYHVRPTSHIARISTATSWRQIIPNCVPRIA